MPSSATLLQGLHAIANQYRYIAVSWHLLLGVALISIAAGWRPPQPTAARWLALLPLSVGVVAVLARNPFNAVVFLALAVAMLAIAARLPEQRVGAGPDWAIATGAGFIALGWAYPHFLEAPSFVAYLVAAPLGTIPCPTLLALIGFSLVSPPASRAWGLLLAAIALFYGVIGVALLGVTIDLFLIAGAVMVGLATVKNSSSRPKAELGGRAGSPPRSPVRS